MSQLERSAGIRTAGGQVPDANLGWRGARAGWLEVQRRAAGRAEAFAYDPVGNRLSKTDGSGTTSYTYDVANQMLTAGGDTYTYDPNGSVISKLTAGGALTTFTYDFQNRITQITGPQGNERSQYAPDGARVDIYGSTVDTQYNPGEVGPTYDLQGNPVLDMGTDRLPWIYRLYGPGIDEPLAEWRRINSQTTFLHKDALGSITAVSAPSGAVSYRITYNAFGERSQTAPPSGIIPTRLSYTARENSVGSLMQYRSRHYETATGRFLTQDQYRGNEASPPSLQRYQYVLNNPIGYTDPTGSIAVTHLAGLIFITLGILMIKDFVEFWGAMLLDDEDAFLDPSSGVYGFLLSLEESILAIFGAVYIVFGLTLLAGAAHPLAQRSEYIFPIFAALRLVAAERALVLPVAIIAGCAKVLTPLFRPRSQFDARRFAFSVSFCVFGAISVIRTRGQWRV